MFVEGKYFRYAGGIFGGILAALCWAISPAHKYLDDRYAVPESEYLWFAVLSLGVSVAFVFLAAVWLPRWVKGTVKFGEGENGTGIRTGMVLVNVCAITVIAMCLGGEVTNYIHGHASEVLGGAPLALAVMLATMVPSIYIGTWLGWRAGGYPFTLTDEYLAKTAKENA